MLLRPWRATKTTDADQSMVRSHQHNNAMLVGVAGLLFAGGLLNEEGVNRKVTTQSGVED